MLLNVFCDASATFERCHGVVWFRWPALCLSPKTRKNIGVLGSRLVFFWEEKETKRKNKEEEEEEEKAADEEKEAEMQVCAIMQVLALHASVM